MSDPNRSRIQPPAWIVDLQRPDYSPDALKALRRADELASGQGRPCGAAHVAYVLLAEVIASTGVPTPWGADVPGATSELLEIASQELSSEGLKKLVDATAAHSQPAKAGLKDLCTALFDSDVGLKPLLERRGFTPHALKLALQASIQNLVPTTAGASPSFAVGNQTQRQRTQAAEIDEDTSVSLLERFGKDLVAEAAIGRLDFVFGRDKEVNRVLRALARRNKPNVCLLGPPGVGKTAVVEEVARRIHSGQKHSQANCWLQAAYITELGLFSGRYKIPW